MPELRIPPKLELWVKLTLILANIAIFLGIIFAAIQYSNTLNRYRQAERFNREQHLQALTFEKRQNAIDAVNKIYNNAFINSFAILKGNKTIKNNEITTASNLVFNTYFIIAIIYNNNIADNNIIGKSIKQSISEFIKFPFYKNKSKSSTKNEIDKMVNDIKNNN